MTKLTFFHQKRKDGAVRTGVELDDELVLERFIPGGEQSDSSILWYVDVRCRLETPIPPDSASVRRILEEISEPLKTAMLAMAADLRAGLDSDVWPIRQKIENLPQHISADVVCSAMKRVTDGELSMVLRELAANWPKALGEMHETLATT